MKARHDWLLVSDRLLMIFLIISILFLIFLAFFLRVGVAKGAGGLELAAIYRIVGGIAAIAYLIFEYAEPEKTFELPSAELCIHSILAAVLYWVSGFASINALRFGPLGVTWTVLRLSMIIPTLASMFIWHEMVLPPSTISQWCCIIGVIVAIASVILIGWDHVNKTNQKVSTKGHVGRWLFFLFVAFLCQGLWEVSLKISGGFERGYDRRMFVAMVMIFSMIFSVPVLFARYKNIFRASIAYGIIAGICAFFGSGLRPWALEKLPGVIVFPVTSVAVTVLVIVAGLLFWREKISKLGYLGIATAVLGIILISLK